MRIRTAYQLIDHGVNAMTLSREKVKSNDPFSVVLQDCSALEWDRRVDLAALYRLACIYGWTDNTATHFSARLSDDPNHFLLNAFDMLFEEITASNLTKFNFDGTMSTADRVKNEAGFVIHSSVLEARPDINFVMHTHTRAGMAVSAMKCGLLPISQHACEIIETVSNHPYQDSTTVSNEGELLGRDLGKNYCMLLENHGFLIVGRTAAEVFWYHYKLEMSCKIQVDVMHATDDYIEISPEARKPLREWGNPENGPHGEVEWPAMLRMLGRKHPDYKT